MSSAPKTHASWSSSRIFIMAAMSATAFGNIWIFPTLAARHGGAAFVLIYLLAITIIGMPVLIAQIAMGRQGRSNPINAMITLARASDASKLWATAAILGTLAGLVILCFYSAGSGWAADFLIESSHYFQSSHQGNKELLLAWHSLFILLTVAVVAAGVVRGIGNIVRILSPILVFLLLALVTYAASQGDLARGIGLLLLPDFSRLTGYSVLIAMGLPFFTLGIGLSTMMAYGAWLPADASIPKTALMVTLCNTLLALLASLAIFSLLFTGNIEPGVSPELMFDRLPAAFGNLPGGTIFGTLFFILLCSASWGSSIAMIEPAVAWMEENLLTNRIAAAVTIGGVTWVGGVACIYIDGLAGKLEYLGVNILLPLAGLMTALFAGWIMKRKLIKNQLGDLSYYPFNTWYAVLRVFTPIGIILVFLYGIGLF